MAANPHVRDSVFVYGSDTVDWDAEYEKIVSEELLKHANDDNVIVSKSAFGPRREVPVASFVKELERLTHDSSQTPPVQCAAHDLLSMLQHSDCRDLAVVVRRGSVAMELSGIGRDRLENVADLLAYNAPLALNLLRFGALNANIDVNPEQLKVWGAELCTRDVDEANDRVTAVMVVNAPTQHAQPSATLSRRLVSQTVHLSKALDLMRESLGLRTSAEACVVRYVWSEPAFGFSPSMCTSQADQVRDMLLGMPDLFESDSERPGVIVARAPVIVIVCRLPQCVLPNVVRFVQQTLVSLSDDDLGIQHFAVKLVKCSGDESWAWSDLDAAKHELGVFVGHHKPTYLTKVGAGDCAAVVCWVEKDSGRFVPREKLFTRESLAVRFVASLRVSVPPFLLTASSLCSAIPDLTLPLSVQQVTSTVQRVLVDARLHGPAHKNKLFFGDDKTNFSCVVDTGAWGNRMFPEAFEVFERQDCVVPVAIRSTTELIRVGFVSATGELCQVHVAFSVPLRGTQGYDHLHAGMFRKRADDGHAEYRFPCLLGLPFLEGASLTLQGPTFAGDGDAWIGSLALAQE